MVDSRDKYFNADKVKALLESTHPANLDIVREDESSDHIPSFLWKTIAAVVLIGLIPGSMVLRMRAATSEQPRLHVFFDMDFQPKKKYQQTTSLFADGRASRPPVVGTMARGDLGNSDPYQLGYTPEPLALDGSTTNVRMVSLTAQDDAKKEDAKKDDGKKDDKANAQAPAAAAPADGGGAAQPAADPERNWVKDLPIDGDEAEKMMALGKKKYNTICSACHGIPGDGTGLVAQRAAELAQGYWVPPTSLHDPAVQAQPVGKIFNTITNGKGKMGAYGNVLSAKERWAIVLYVRALQLSRDAKDDVLTEDEIKKLTAARTSK